MPNKMATLAGTATAFLLAHAVAAPLQIPWADWTLYPPSTESAAPDVATTGVITLSPKLVDESPIVYEFYDNNPGVLDPATRRPTNDFRPNLNLNITTENDWVRSFIVDTLTIPPVRFVGAPPHPTEAHRESTVSISSSDIFHMQRKSSTAGCQFSALGRQLSFTSHPPKHPRAVG